MDVSHLFREMEAGTPVRVVLLSEASEDELGGISEIMGIGLSTEEMSRIRTHFISEGRDPTDVELEALGQAWSEHCCYKSSKYFMKRSFIGIKAPQTVIEGEDAGVVEFDDEHVYCVGLESHNHPSAIGPYGGSATGVGGIIRDVLCMGAQPIAVIDPLFFGPLDTPAEEVPEGINHPRFIYSGVVAGIRDYGNRIGIPTVAGMVNFHPGYTGNPLVNVGCVGIGRKENVIHSRVGGPGEVYILAGGRTGRDGIHGVTFASADLSAESEEKDRGSVQLGDPITKEPLIHSCLEANEKGLLRGMKDLGGGGLSCVSGEMALDGGAGAVIHLDRVPLKEEGLAPWEIWVSESQERMMVSVAPENVDAVLHMFRKWDVEAVVIGEVVEGKRVKALWHGRTILDLDLEFFTAGPEYCRIFESRKVDRDIPDPGIGPLPREKLEDALLSILSSPNICSKEDVFRVYDHEVRGRTVIKPYAGMPFSPGPSDAAVIKPLEDSYKGIVITADVNPYFCELDPYRGTLSAMEESVRNLVSTGAYPHSVTDCLNFGNPEKPDRLGDFERACTAIGEFARHFTLPVVSGNVSLYNESEIGKVPPTPTIMMVGLIDDIRSATTPDLKEKGNIIYLVGRTRNEMGGTAFFRYMGVECSCVPDVDLELSGKCMDAILEMNGEGLLFSVHDLSEGGLAAAISEMCIGGGLGADINIRRVGSMSEDEGEPMDVNEKLFSESNSRYLIEVPPQYALKVEDCLSRKGAPYTKLGTVLGDSLRITDGETILMDVPVSDLDYAWRNGLRKLMEGS
ncbi:phosphoribosylformylglycinamidine synthase II [Thermoplasmatales archaeon ex4484_6]|nr:MAG: phosphoribosylformylglycinamidine synthase II [Thermoplasmatales archaeon ex4484_6]RLF68921.1 MAG: phosphoribosylformylglycinamidine synthase subunit PurL [Thermoplasmata archaeon]